MAGELLGLLVGWALIFALPVVVAWAAIRIVVTAREAIGKRRAPDRVPVSHGDTHDVAPVMPEPASDPDAHATELDTVPGKASADSQRKREES